MLRSESIVKITEALIAAQKEIVPVIKDKIAKGTKFNFAYADLSAVIDAIKEPLNKNNIIFSQATVKDGEGFTVETMLYHISGEFLGSITPIFMASEDPQAFGSAVTYAKRYGLSALLGIATEDDDGGAAKDLKGNKIVPPTTLELSTINAICDKMFDSIPDGQIVSPQKVAACLWNLENKYPPDGSDINKIALVLIRDHMKELCVPRSKKDIPPQPDSPYKAECLALKKQFPPTDAAKSAVQTVYAAVKDFMPNMWECAVKTYKVENKWPEDLFDIELAINKLKELHDIQDS